MDCPQCGYALDEDEIDRKEPRCPHCGDDLTWLLRKIDQLRDA